MTAIPPSRPPAGLPPAATASPPTTAAVSPASPPASLAAIGQMAVNDQITAAVLASPARGTAVVQTPAGALTLRLPMPLPEGAQVTLQVITTGATPQLRVVAVNGQAVAANGQILPSKVQSPSPPPLAGVEEMPEASSASDAHGITATVLNTPPPTTGQTPLPPGTSLVVRIAGFVLPEAAQPESDAMPEAAQSPTAPAAPQAAPAAPQPLAAPPAQGPQPEASPAASLPQTAAQQSAPQASPSPQQAPPQAAPQAPPAPQAPQQSAPQAPPAPQAPQQGAPLPISTPQAPQQATPVAQAPPQTGSPPPAPQQALPDEPAPLPDAGPPPSPPSMSLEGTVAANSRPGNPLIQTAIGTLSLAAVIDLPPGTKVELTVIGQPTPPPRGGPAPPAQSPWPGLQKLLDGLDQAEPHLARQIAAHLPEIGPKLAAQLAILAGAAQRGSAAEWLGQATLKALDPAKGHALAAELDQALSGLKSSASLATLGGHWQSLILPFLFGEQMESLRLVVRRPPEDEKEARARGEEGTRFLVDVEMSRLGPLQLDGLVRGQAKRFDLIVRAQKALPEAMRQDIARIFGEALEGYGMTGSASFQTTSRFVELLKGAGRPGASFSV